MLSAWRIARGAFTAFWFWLPMIYGATVLFSFFMGMAYGIAGIFASYWWVYILILLEYLRQRKLVRLGLFRTEQWEVPTAKGAEALKTYIELLNRDRKTHNPSPLQH